MDEVPSPDAWPASLKYLRRLVTVLTGTMILGLLTIIALLVMRFGPASGPQPVETLLPEQLSLPLGVGVRGITATDKWYALVTEEDEILVFDRAQGVLRQRIAIAPPAE